MSFSGTGPVAPPPRPVVFGRGAVAGPANGRPGPGQGPGHSPGLANPVQFAAAAAATTTSGANGASLRSKSRSPPPRTRSGIPSGKGKGSGLARMPSSTEGAAREEEAKARRVKRFGADQPDLVPVARDVPPVPALSSASVFSPVTDNMVEDQDWPGMEGGDAILGTCTDMCPGEGMLS